MVFVRWSFRPSGFRLCSLTPNLKPLVIIGFGGFTVRFRFLELGGFLCRAVCFDQTVSLICRCICIYAYGQKPPEKWGMIPYGSPID